MKQWTLFKFAAGSDITALTATQLKRLKQIVWICLIAALAGCLVSGPKSSAILRVALLTAATRLRQILAIRYGIGTILVGSWSSKSMMVAPVDTK